LTANIKRQVQIRQICPFALFANLISTQRYILNSKDFSYVAYTIETLKRLCNITETSAIKDV